MVFQSLFRSCQVSLYKFCLWLLYICIKCLFVSRCQCLIIGAGPCGLRTAIELALLGAKVVLLEKRDAFSRNNVLHLWPFTIQDLRGLGAKKFYGKFCAGAIDHISECSATQRPPRARVQVLMQLPTGSCRYPPASADATQNVAAARHRDPRQRRVQGPHRASRRPRI